MPVFWKGDPYNYAPLKVLMVLVVLTLVPAQTVFSKFVVVKDFHRIFLCVWIKNCLLQINLLIWD